MSDVENRDLWEQAQESLFLSWETHRQAFGPILEPAFLENQQVRIPLIAALNHISRREVKRGLEILQSIKEYCIYEEDKAAWTFFVGLCFEMAGQKERSLQWYEDAGKYGHRFYLPYLKIAKAAHEAEHYEKAIQCYKTAVSCIEEMREEERDEIILGSAYTNMTACLTMLYRYKEAQQAWNTAVKYPQQAGAAATAAILYAAMGYKATCQSYLEQLKETMPDLAAEIGNITQQILQGRHPHFMNQAKGLSSMITIKAGDWVTQYSAGFWMVVDIKPKYAESDYDSKSIHWKKGDLIGQWAILKKAFTPKMKKFIRCECVDLSQCQLVSLEERETIARFFRENPAYAKKFSEAPAVDEPSVHSVFMNIPEAEEAAFQSMLATLPETYTIQEFWEQADTYKACVSQPPASHILTFRHHCWAVNSDFEPILFGASLEKCP